MTIKLRNKSKKFLDLLVRQQKLVAVRIHALAFDTEPVGLHDDRLPDAGLKPYALPSGRKNATLCKGIKSI